MRTARRKISRAVDWILGAHPYLASIVCRFEISRDDEKTDSAATDGRHLYFNGPFMDSLTQLEASWVILHEAGHVFLGHHIREKGKTQHGSWNEAADLALNDLIKGEPGFKHGDYAVAGEGEYADLPSGKAADWYYGRLAKKEEARKPEPGEDPGQGDQPGGDQPQQGQGDKPVPSIRAKFCPPRIPKPQSANGNRWSPRDCSMPSPTAVVRDGCGNWWTRSSLRPFPTPSRSSGSSSAARFGKERPTRSRTGGEVIWRALSCRPGARSPWAMWRSLWTPAAR